MLSREQAITRLNAYGVPISEEEWQDETGRSDGEFGVFAIIIRVIAGLFILGMVSISIAGFIALTGLEDSWESVAGLIGVLATAFAAWKFRHSYQTLEKQYSFTGLLYLSLLLVGKACLLAALFGWFEVSWWRDEDVWTVAVAFSAITLLSCFYYRMYLESFLAVLMCLFLLDAAITNLLFSIQSGAAETANVSPFWARSFQMGRLIVILSLILGMGALIWRQQRHNLSSVFLYAVTLYLSYTLVPFAASLRLWGARQSMQNWDISVLGFAAVLVLYTFLIGGIQKLKSLEHVITICCMLILAVLGMHGVLFAVALLALGHVRHDRVLWVIGLIYLPVYLVDFYYALDVTLLAKSYMLLGSGIAILAARYVLLRFFAPTSGEVDHA